MFIFSTKLTKTKLLTVGLISACLVLLLLISIPRGADASKDAVQGGSNEDRIGYLQTFGWEVSGEPIEAVSVSIPTEFDTTYDEYNALQISQGFDLRGYRGDSGMRYTYTVSNYPNTDGSGVYANVIVIEDKIVAADISGISNGGFMHTLQMPQASAADTLPTSSDLTKEDILASVSQNGK